MMAGSCAPTRTDRIARGVVSVFLASFALSTLDNLWCAIPASICATFLMIGAITGWCPTDLFRSRGTAAPNAFGFPEARDSLNQSPKKPTIDA